DEHVAQGFRCSRRNPGGRRSKGSSDGAKQPPTAPRISSWPALRGRHHSVARGLDGCPFGTCWTWCSRSQARPRWRGKADVMLITTMNDVPGYEIEEVLGEVFGLTVRSRNVGSQFGAWLKSLRGGELKGMTKMLAEGRQHATERLVEEAES